MPPPRGRGASPFGDPFTFGKALVLNSQPPAAIFASASAPRADASASSDDPTGGGAVTRSRVSSRACPLITRLEPDAASCPTRAPRAATARTISRGARVTLAETDETRRVSRTDPPSYPSSYSRAVLRTGATRRGFHASAVPEPCPARAAAVASR